MLCGVREVISWKQSFTKLGEELETAKKKKQVLDCLLDTGRISQSTHDLFNADIAEAIADVERQQKALLQKMDSKIAELEEQIKTLEVLLANFEIQHVTGEVSEEVYQREIDVLSMGLEASRQELDALRDAASQLLHKNVPVEQEVKMEPVKSVEPTVESVVKPVMEYVEVHETKPSQNAAEPKAPDTSVEGEEKQGT